MIRCLVGEFVSLKDCGFWFEPKVRAKVLTGLENEYRRNIKMHIHILGICGTFMGSLAQLAKALGHRVTGSDTNVYPPMSTQLEAAGIELTEGFDPAQLNPAPDLVVVGNAMSRGNPAVEDMLEKGLRYTSGPHWLSEYVLQDKWVLAVAGTHGKTTTTAMLTWILDSANMAPGYLIGGVPKNFSSSARLGETPFFVVEADEYDSAFFDKRSKFIHYRPRTVILNNLEFDHADIFSDLAAIQTQFHHLVRTIPANGLIVEPADDANVKQVLDERGCWTERQVFAVLAADDPLPDAATASSQWLAVPRVADGSCFVVYQKQDDHWLESGRVNWSHTGNHNMKNALAALCAARHVGVPVEQGCEALSQFAGVKRRMEVLGTVNGITVYDDFAHHPTAIKTTLAGLRKKVGSERIVAVIEPRSNTMRMGMHRNNLAQSCVDADDVLWYQPAGLNWNLDDVVNHSPVPAKVCTDLAALQEDALRLTRDGGHIVIMSNGGFGGVHQQLLARLQTQQGESV